MRAHMFKRIMAAFVSVSLVCGLVPTAALAEGVGEEGAPLSQEEAPAVEATEDASDEPASSDVTSVPSEEAANELDAASPVEPSAAENEDALVDEVPEEVAPEEERLATDPVQLAADDEEAQGERREDTTADQQVQGVAEPDSSPDATEPEGVDDESDETILVDTRTEPALATTSKVTVTYEPVEPITFILGEVEWSDFYQSYHYQYWPQDGDKLTVTDGGKKLTYTFSSTVYQWRGPDGYFGHGVEVDLYADLSKTQNKLGTHQLTVMAKSYSEWSDTDPTGTVDFKLVESPITSISYKPAHPIVLVYNVDSSKYYEYDPNTKTGHTYHHYFFPTGTRLLGDKLIVTREINGSDVVTTYVYSSFKNPEDGYDELGYVNTEDDTDIIYLDDLLITSEQPYSKRWGTGKHSFTVNYKGKTDEIPVTVKADTVTKIAYKPKTAVTRSTKKAIAYTQKMGIYSGSYAKRVTKYQIVFAAYKPKTGDVLKVTTGEATSTKYIYNASKDAYVSTSDSSKTIPTRDVEFRSMTVDVSTKKVSLPCIYRGKTYKIPVTVTKAAQTVKTKNKQLVRGKKCNVNATTTGFTESTFTYKSSNTKVATVNSKGVITGKRYGTVKITIRVKANAAFKKSKVKTITVKVGKANPMTVTYKKSVSVKPAKLIRVAKAKKAVGKVTYTNVSSNKTAKKFKIGKTSGRLKVPKGTKKGTYTLKVKVKAAGKDTYLAKTKTVTIKVKVK